MQYLTCRTMKEEGRLYFENSRDNVAVIFVNKENGVTIAVSEEMALDSYNSTLECAMELDQNQARQLRDYLVKNVR